MASTTASQSRHLLQCSSLGVSGKPPWWLSTWRMVIPSLPFLAKPGQCLATGSSQDSWSRCHRICRQAAVIALVDEKRTNMVSALTG